MGVGSVFAALPSRCVWANSYHPPPIGLPYDVYACASSAAPPGISVTDVHDNELYLPGGPIFECGMPITDYQASCEGCDPRTVAHAAWPADAVILDAARKALGMPAV